MVVIHFFSSEMRSGKVIPYACGALRNTKILGYGIDFEDVNLTSDRHSLSSGYMTSLTKFCQIDIELEPRISNCEF